MVGAVTCWWCKEEEPLVCTVNFAGCRHVAFFFAPPGVKTNDLFFGVKSFTCLFETRACIRFLFETNPFCFCLKGLPSYTRVCKINGSRDSWASTKKDLFKKATFSRLRACLKQGPAFTLGCHGGVVDT